MGYRSEVSVTVRGESLKVLDALMAHDKDLEILINKDSDECTRDDDSIRVHWEEIKWYDSYDEITSFESFLANADEEEYHFIRIGENLDDLESRGYLDSGMYVQRSIVCW